MTGPRSWRSKGLRRLAGALGVVGLLVGLGLALAWLVPLPERLQLPGSMVVRWQDGEVAHLSLAPDERWRVPVGLDEVDPLYIDALLRFEDKRFRSHPGVDPVAIGRALVSNLSAGRVVSGASTITMQVVRLAEPRPRTLGSKLIEALRAVQLELRMDKDEILEAYLALAPFGGNLEGVETASQAYFGHGAKHLSPAEIATLLAVPQSPSRRAPSAANEARLRLARDEIAARLLAEGLLEPHLRDDDAPGSSPAGVTAAEVHARILATAVPVQLFAMPRAVPHVVAWMTRGGQPGTIPGDTGPGGEGRARAGQEIDLWLDRGSQATVERLTANIAPGLAARGIHQLAVVVVEHDTGRIRALVGGTDFFSGVSGAQIPAFAVPRSPGSTLKPLLYTRALERGLILPATLMEDIPTRYGGYSPVNYDGSFDGLVPAEEALSRSLNVPFVRLLQRVGIEPFVADLRALGARSLVSDPGHYGLSAIIGGIELTPLEVARFYTALARGGQDMPLLLRQDDPAAEARRVFSPGASWLTARALARRDRPDFPSRHLLSAAPRFIRWKTGTSFGNRDAWAVGWGTRLTIAVWMGNLDQRGSASLVGADVAGPLLFDLFDALRDGHSSDPGAMASAPDEVGGVEVCSLSGRLPGSACPERVRELALTAKVPVERCAMHVEVEIDQETGARVGPECRQGRSTSREVRVEWPPAVRAWLRERYRSEPFAPPWDPSCRPAERGEAPRLVSPASGQVVVLIPGLPAAHQQLPLQAESDSESLSWFVDGELLETLPSEDTAWWTPSPGDHTLVVMDALGRSTSQPLAVVEGRRVGLGP